MFPITKMCKSKNQAKEAARPISPDAEEKTAEAMPLVPVIVDFKGLMVLDPKV